MPEGARLIEWTGERCVPWAPDSAMLYEHYHRYLWARRALAGRRVLDLGSGEGFGAALLAELAQSVVGVDVDQAAVEHAARTYGEMGNLGFGQASALDLTQFADGSFDAVVAFEMIEHVSRPERVLDEAARVLAADGLLIVSTPDRDLYGEATGQVNEFHEHELSREEFHALLSERFAHVELWGQRTITGSFLRALEPEAREDGGERADFLVRRDERGIALEEPAPIFIVALASRAALPALGASSTLADPGLELLHETARAYAKSVAERDRLLGEAHERVNEAARMLEDKRVEALRLGDELAAARRQLRLIEQSVSWQIFQRSRATVYGLIGEDSRLGRALGGALRLLGRIVLRGGAGRR